MPTSRGVSLVPQGKRIFSNLSVEENILLGRASRRTGSWTLSAQDDYNNKDKARNVWVSVNFSF